MTDVTGISCWGCGVHLDKDNIWCPLHGLLYSKCDCGYNPELELCENCAVQGAEQMKIQYGMANND